MSANTLRCLGLICLGLLASATSSQGRLNETFDEIRARYGYVDHIDYQPRADYPLYIFQKDGIAIGVRFIDGKSAQEIYTTSGPVADFGASDLLAANAQGSRWLELTVGKSESYQRADGRATAEYMRSSKTSKDPAVLVIQTSQFNELVNAPGLGF